ncbi:MAG: phosphosulfolactate synthase [Rhizobiaceae bacterium]
MSSSQTFTDLLIGQRAGKPRIAGSTWITLFGEGPKQLEALLQTSGEFIDRAKLAYGSALLAGPEVLKNITSILRDHDIEPYPGGTILEMAIRLGKAEAFYDWAQEMGFTGIEICDGVIEMTREERSGYIRMGIERGLNVTTVVQECIRKPIVEIVPLNDRIARAQADLAAGASQAHFIYQAMARGETPSDVVGPLKFEQVKEVISRIGSDRMVCEALSVDDQLKYLRAFGGDISLGHVDPRTVVQLEAQRRKLGYETFWSSVWGRPHWS